MLHPGTGPDRVTDTRPVCSNPTSRAQQVGTPHHNEQRETGFKGGAWPRAPRDKAVSTLLSRGQPQAHPPRLFHEEGPRTAAEAGPQPEPARPRPSPAQLCPALSAAPLSVVRKTVPAQLHRPRALLPPASPASRSQVGGCVSGGCPAQPAPEGTAPASRLRRRIWHGDASLQGVVTSLP